MDELTLTYNADKMELTIQPIDSSRLQNITEVVRCKDCQFLDTEGCPMRETPGDVLLTDFLLIWRKERRMNPLHLLWIVPLSAMLGFYACAILVASKDGDNL